MKSLVPPHWIAIPALAAFPLLLYIIAGYGGHDFLYHAASWMELHDAWSVHQWRLGWSQWAQYGFGEPRFCFYPPLSLLIGAGLTFVMPFRFVPGVVVWLLLTLSGLCMYKALGAFVEQKYRLPAAILYMFNPYLMMTVVIRYAIAEAWVQALLPLTFLYVYLVITEARWKLVGIAACLVAAGWLTNIPEAIGLFYAFNLLAAVVAIHARSIKPLAGAALVQFLALLLAAFRLLPALREKTWVSSQNLLIYDFRAYMQLSRTPPPHLLIGLAGVYIVLVLALILPAARRIVHRGGGWSTPLVALLSLTGFAVLFQLPLTTPLWIMLPQFKFILFPYRLLPLLSLSSVLLLFAPAVTPQLRRLGTVCLLLFALVSFPCYTRLLPFQRFHSITVALATWRTGFKGVKEYVPAGVPHAGTVDDAEPGMAKQGAFGESACKPVLMHASPNEKLIRTHSDTTCLLVLDTFYYPFWTATLQSGLALPVSASSSGLMTVSVPAGVQEITFEFIPATRTRTLAALLSLCTLASVFAWTWVASRRSGRFSMPPKRSWPLTRAA